MKKNLLVCFLVITSLFTYGQVTGYSQASYPIGYYDDATGTGYNLKTQLYGIIESHTVLSYTPGLWDLYKEGNAFKDNWYENDGTLLDIYSENPDGADPYVYQLGTSQCGNVGSEGTCYNREHLIPQSIFNKKSPMVSDAFHIWPTDGKVNGMRDNYPFGKVGKVTWTSLNGSRLGSSDASTGYTGTVFEPIDEFKGDIARAYFYFATRYENTIDATWKDYPMFNKLDKNQFFTDSFRNILLTWHAMDPVSDREIAVNEAIYSKQKNRNPYIDHPEWIETIWGKALGIDDFEYQPRDFLDVYPTLSHDGIIYVKSKSSQNQIKKVSVFSMNGVVLQTVINSNAAQELKLQINGSGIYIIKILGNNFEVNRKVIVK